MSIPVLSQHRCNTPHINVRDLIQCAYPNVQAAGVGKFAVLLRCNGTQVLQYGQLGLSIAAFNALKANTCSPTCEQKHTLVRFSVNPSDLNHHRTTYESRRRNNA